MRTLLLCLVLAMSGCTGTVTPAAPRPAAASYDGNYRDSGILAIDQNGAMITAHARDRYNGLIAIYGKDPQFSGALVPDFGITPADPYIITARQRGPLFMLSKEGIVYFSRLNRLRRLSTIPTK